MTAPMRRGRLRGDSGVTLIELIVAMGVFSVLLVLITGLVVQATRALNSAAGDANVQQQQQNAILWMSRLLRYADNPVETSPLPSAIESATGSALTFYSFAGTGPTDRVPYRVTLRACPPASTACQEGDVISEIQAPAMLNGRLATPSSPTFGTAAVRSLVRAQPDRIPSVRFTYLDADDNDLLAADPGGTVPTERHADIAAVRVLVTDPDSGMFADQTVRLVNPR